MNFTDVRFWQFLTAGVAAIFLLRFLVQKTWPAVLDRFDKSALLGLGLFLLSQVSWVTFLIFIAVALGSYLGLSCILRRPEQERRAYLWLLIPLQLAPLAYYKYANFVCNQLLGFRYDTLRDLVIPVGISFYTFQKVAFVLDTIAFKQPLPAVLDYLNFAGFFPQIVAGPIERRRDLLPQMANFRFRWLPGEIDAAVPWIVIGLFFKCCLADNLAVYFDPQSRTNPFSIWLANLLFGLRIYYDFAGYSLIAFGLARALGVRLTLNFVSPYCATSIVEFWRRWHVTLSQWFRDYLYVPLGGGRVRTWPLNVALVFAVSGVWHGAGWNFILWGALHGGYLIVNRLYGPRLKPAAWIGWLLTMLGCFVAWLCFYELNTGVLLAKLKTLGTPAGYSVAALRGAFNRWPPADQIVLATFVMLATVTLLFEWRSVTNGREAYGWLRRPAALVVLVVLTVLLAPARNNGFIYFNF